MSEVIYHTCSIPEFQGNPLIEALPELMDEPEVARRLSTRPSYEIKERNASQKERKMLTQKITQFYQPGSKDMDLFDMVDRSLRWGYVWRNPLAPYYRLLFGGITPEKSGAYYAPYIPTTGGFALLGISGLGKTSSIRQILSLFPEVIFHSEYKGEHFQETQIVWIHMDIPKDGSLKGMCSDFFSHIDQICGSNFHDQYCRKRATLDDMLHGMIKVAASVHLGILVLDEVQNLCVSKSSDAIPLQTLNFLVTLINTIHVPVAVVGTPRALSFFQKEFQQAKRVSAQGASLWERMKENVEWKRFVRAMWDYQYTSKLVTLTDELEHTLYEESAGIPFLAVHIYKLVQEMAITSGTETFGEDDIRLIVSKKLKLTKPMVEALKSGRDINLREYLDLTPFSANDYRRLFPNSPIQDEPPEKTDKQTLQDKARMTLLGIGVPPAAIQRYMNKVIVKHPDCQSDIFLAQKAYEEYLKDKAADDVNKADADDTQDHVVVGYEKNLQNGKIGL